MFLLNEYQGESVVIFFLTKAVMKKANHGVNTLFYEKNYYPRNESTGYHYSNKLRAPKISSNANARKKG